MSEEKIIVEIKFSEDEEYIIREARMYANKSELIEWHIVNSEPYRVCFLDVYKKFVDGNGLVPIEKLDLETKQTLWDDSMKLQPLVISTSHRISICRCIWLLNFVFEKYF